jgi:hypothetical protein
MFIEFPKTIHPVAADVPAVAIAIIGELRP